MSIVDAKSLVGKKAAQDQEHSDGAQEWAKRVQSELHDLKAQISDLRYHALVVSASLQAMEDIFVNHFGLTAEYIREKVQYNIERLNQIQDHNFDPDGF